MSKLKLTASDIDACMSGPEVGPVDAGMIAEQALAAIELEAALAAAEAKLADSYRERDTLNTQLEEAAKLLADERRHADRLNAALAEFGEHSNWCFGNPCDCPTGLAIAAHAARRAAEVANG